MHAPIERPFIFTQMMGRGEEFYHYSFSELAALVGEAEALRKVRFYQELADRHQAYPGFVLHRCRLLETFREKEAATVKGSETPQSVLHTRVSVFYAPVSNITRHKDLTLYQVHELIRSGKFKRHTEALKKITDKKANRQYKATHFSYACFSGTFSKRYDEALLAHSGLICIDLDHVGERLDKVRAAIRGEESYVMDFVSPNGDGLKVLFKINPHLYSQEVHYRALSSHLSLRCGLPLAHIDLSCKNVSRACFLPHDPTVHLNPLLQ